MSSTTTIHVIIGIVLDTRDVLAGTVTTKHPRYVISCIVVQRVITNDRCPIIQDDIILWMKRIYFHARYYTHLDYCNGRDVEWLSIITRHVWISYMYMYISISSWSSLSSLLGDVERRDVAASIGRILLADDLMTKNIMYVPCMCRVYQWVDSIDG